MAFDPTWILSALLTLLIVFFKVWSNRNDKRLEQIEAHQEDAGRSLEKLRIEVYKDFVRGADHRLLREDIRGIFEKINDLAESVHTLIGQHHRETKKR